jgi:hypothetical protein
MDLEAIKLPSQTHAAGLWPTDPPPPDTPPDHVVIWADRPYRLCPNCGQPIPRNPGCPLTITDGAVIELPQTHTCGTPLPVTWQGAAPDPDNGEFTPRTIRRTAAQVMSQWKQQATAAREHTRGELLRDLAVALSQLTAPENPDTGDIYESRAIDITTGSAEQPGIWHNGTMWCAWNYDPASDSDTATITVTRLDVAQHWKDVVTQTIQ